MSCGTVHTNHTCWADSDCTLGKAPTYLSSGSGSTICLRPGEENVRACRSYFSTWPKKSAPPDACLFTQEHGEKTVNQRNFNETLTRCAHTVLRHVRNNYSPMTKIVKTIKFQHWYAPENYAKASNDPAWPRTC